MNNQTVKKSVFRQPRFWIAAIIALFILTAAAGAQTGRLIGYLLNFVVAGAGGYGWFLLRSQSKWKYPEAIFAGLVLLGLFYFTPVFEATGAIGAAIGALMQGIALGIIGAGACLAFLILAIYVGTGLYSSYQSHKEGR